MEKDIEERFKELMENESKEKISKDINENKKYDEKISYGCIAALFDKINPIYNIQNKKTEIMLITLLKFHEYGILELKEDFIKFNTLSDSSILDKFDTNEKTIYKFIKSLSFEGVLKIEELMNSIEKNYTYFRDKMIDVDNDIDGELYKYIDTKKKKILIVKIIVLIIINFLSIIGLINFVYNKIALYGYISVFVGIITFLLICITLPKMELSNLLNKKTNDFLNIFDKYAKHTDDFIDGKDKELSIKELEVCAKVAIILEYYSEFMEALAKQKEIQNEETYLKYLKFYSGFVGAEIIMDEQMEKIQSNLSASKVSITQMYHVYRGMSK